MKNNLIFIMAVLIGNIVIVCFLFLFTHYLLLLIKTNARPLADFQCVYNPYRCYFRNHKLKVVNLKEDIPNRIEIK